MLTSRILATARLFALIAPLFLADCASSPPRQVNADLDDKIPKKIVWAWQRPEDLRFLDPKEFGVAFLAQTIFLEEADVRPDRRRQPLEVNPGTYLIAVTRIETQKDNFRRPTFDPQMVSTTVSLVLATLQLPDVKGIQIDFDAMASERSFYRSLLREIRRQTPEGITLTMTALASWCAGDTWFSDFPVDEAVPMVFVMGADSEKIRNFLRNGNDWNEPLCRGSYGISIEEGGLDGMSNNRRMYFFKNTAWFASDLAALR